MPLPITKEKLVYVDRNQNVVEGEIKKRETGYSPTPDYHPTMRAVRCLACGMVGALEFEGGFNLKLGDRVMDGKPIPGTCPKCSKKTELIPLPVNDPSTREVRLYYEVQKSLDLYTKHGIKLSPTGMVWPEARIRDWEEHAKRGPKVQA